MPSIAKMLHHHLPPWASLKSYLKFEYPASSRKGSKRDFVTGYKRSQPTEFNGMNSRQGNRLYTNGSNASAGIELESQKSVDNYSSYITPNKYDDDRISLKQHHPQQA